MSYRKHGHCDNDSMTPTYRTWVGMNYRCSCKTHKKAHLYSNRGISVCETWRVSFDAFLQDMGCRPEGYTLDRIDPNKGYCKENCRWACAVRQSHGRRDIKLSWESVAEMKHMRAEGFLYREIAERFGIHQTHASDVIRGKRWKKQELEIITGDAT